MRITGHPVASGPVTGRPVGRYYTYHGDKPLSAEPDHPRPGAEAVTGRREKRIREFGAFLAALGHDPDTAPHSVVIEAGRHVGVGEDTARDYRNELKRRQSGGEARDA